MDDIIEYNVALVDRKTGKPITTGGWVRVDTLPASAIAGFPPTRDVVAGGPGTCNFYHGPKLASPISVCTSVVMAGYVPQTNGDTPVSFGSDTVNEVIELDSFKRPFQVAPRTWKGNMCGIRVPGLPSVPGGAADPTLFLSWFYDRYDAETRVGIRLHMKAKGYTHWLVSWPDSRSVGSTPQAFLAMCQELIADGFFPCVFLTSKDYDNPDVGSILADLATVLPLLIGVVPMFCIGWELSLWLSPTQVQQLIDAIAPQCLTREGTLVYVHWQQGYLSFQQPGEDTAAFWWLNVGKLTGDLHQRVLDWDKPMYQARIVDCLQRFAGQFNFPTDSGFGHPFDFVALEITAQPQFDGSMSEEEGNLWGDTAVSTPPVGSVAVMGSGNGVSR